MICEPISFIWSIVAHFTALLVPTGIKIGVSITPCGVIIVPARACPSVASREKENVLYIFLIKNFLDYRKKS
jgi:hypothetical protein